MEKYKLFIWLLIGAIWLYSYIKKALNNNRPKPVGDRNNTVTQTYAVKSPLSGKSYPKPNFTSVRPPTSTFKEIIASSKSAKRTAFKPNKQGHPAVSEKTTSVFNYDSIVKDEDQSARQLIADREHLSRQINASDILGKQSTTLKQTFQKDETILNALKDLNEIKKAFVIGEILDRKF